ncbi:MAG: hypothetical protein ACW99Q_05180, partial [Candidatus Kariarchaeaceae archaeon]
KLFPICQENFRRYLIENQPISLKEIHKDFGQDRIITSFKQISSDVSRSNISKLLHDLFIIEFKNNELIVTPTAMGITLYQYSSDYYSPNTVLSRFETMLNQNKLSESKMRLLKLICRSDIPLTNDSKDKSRLASQCGIHKDNISKYLVQMVKLGFLNRIPDEYSNNKFTYQCFNTSIAEKL